MSKLEIDYVQIKDRPETWDEDLSIRWLPDSEHPSSALHWLVMRRKRLLEDGLELDDELKEN